MHFTLQTKDRGRGCSGILVIYQGWFCWKIIGTQYRCYCLGPQTKSKLTAAMQPVGADCSDAAPAAAGYTPFHVMSWTQQKGTEHLEHLLGIYHRAEVAAGYLFELPCLLFLLGYLCDRRYHANPATTLTFLQTEGNTDKITEATHRKMPSAIDSSCFRRPSGKLEKATSTPNNEEIVTTGLSSTVLVSSTPRQSNPTMSVAEVVTPLQEDKNSGRLFEPLSEGSMENRRDSDDVNEEGKGGGNQDGQEAEKGEGLEEVEHDEEDEEEDFKLLESEWQRFKCRLDHDSVATMQMLFRADHTVSFGTRVEFQGSPPKPPAPHFCRPMTELPPRQLFVPPPLEITGHEDAA
eukprot:g83155.t1